MEITNGNVTADLPDNLAQLLIDRRGWKQSSANNKLRSTQRSVRQLEPEDKPIPMTHIPGVVPGVSMNRVKKMVANREVDVYLEGRVKKIKPSDVKTVLNAE